MIKSILKILAIIFVFRLVQVLYSYSKTETIVITALFVVGSMIVIPLAMHTIDRAIREEELAERRRKQIRRKKVVRKF